ncbi:DNA polymerase III subunit gamma/tau [Gemmatimonas sp.]|uniref:DNA polymerase III subunit gamma/tau n=1 Tax=Gemmatimonas sp. TaxID=1962908 RepID=UPI0027BA37C2|nr:DNA polymerase III subunit gamma/tau [Gemmatimonas sp.]
MSLALARKYRPRNFATVAVQSHVANTLKGAIARGRVAHGYLLCGPRGTGKTTLARVLAMALNCERRGEPELQGEPCGECASCQRIWSGSASLDVVEIDAASNGGVADARDLRERAMYAPSGDDRYKVYIIDEAHMLSRDAWNALLKVLEEPPPRVVFVFATTEAQKVLGTVVSRLQRFDLKRIGPAEIRERLAAVLTEEGVRFEDDALGMIARAADGGLRDALSLTDQVLSLGETAEVTSERVTVALGLIPDDEYVALLDVILERRPADVFTLVQRQADAGVDFTLLLAGLGRLLRALLAVTIGGQPPELSDRVRVALDERKGRVSTGDLVRMLHALLDLEPMYRKSGQPQLLLETLLVRFALLDRTVEIEEVLKGFGAGGGHEDPPPRRVAHESRVASAHALPPSPPPAVAQALPNSAPLSAPAAFTPPLPSRTATQQAAAQAAAQQIAAATAPAAHPSAPEARRHGAAPPTLEQVNAAWSRVAEALRAGGRGMVAESVQRLAPLQVSPEGVLALGYSPSDDTFAMAVERARADVIAVLQDTLPGITTFNLRASTSAAATGPAAVHPTTKRLTAHDVQQQRTEQIAAKDPLLEAAVRVLDLELLD